MYLGSNLSYLRKKSGKIQNEAASAMKISDWLLSCYECGSREPCLATLIRIAEFYKVSIDDLLKKDLSNEGGGEGGNCSGG